MIASALKTGLILALAAAGSVQSAEPSLVSNARAVKLMAQLRAASGGHALDRHEAFHETGTVIRDGHAGTYEMYGDLHALRTAGVHTLDGKFGGGGFDGKTAWRIGPDGKVVVITDPIAVRDAKAGAYFTIGGFNWPERFAAAFTSVGPRNYRSRRYDVVRVIPEGGTPSDLWLDRRTHRLSRITAEIGGRTASADVYENRRVDGTLVGFKNHQAETGHVMSQTLATFDYVPLDPRRVALPSQNQE